MEFKIGDKVKILRKAASCENGWQNDWVPDMDKAVGQIGTVVIIPTHRRYDVGLVVSAVGLSTYGYPSFVLELATKKEIKVGDRVNVSWRGSSLWEGPATVVRIYGNGDISIRKDGGLIGSFSPEHITLIESASVPQVPAQEIQAKEKGIARAVGKHTAVFIVARKLAVDLAKKNSNGVVNADQVQDELTKLGYTSSDLGNAAGALFRGKNWIKLAPSKSTRKGNHARDIANWKYVGQ